MTPFLKKTNLVPPGLFFPPGSHANTTQRVVRMLFDSEIWQRIWPYLGSIDIFFRAGPYSENTQIRDMATIDSFIREILFDVNPSLLSSTSPLELLIVSYSSRNHEIRMIQDTFNAFDKSHGRIVCAGSVNGPEAREWAESALPEASLIDLCDIPEHLHETMARKALAATTSNWDAIQSLLAKNHCYLSEDAIYHFAEVSLFVELAEWWIQQLQPRRILLKNAHSTPCCAVAASGHKLGIPVSAFQHCMIGSTSPFIPLMVTRYFTFGEASRSHLIRLEQEFRQDTASSSICESIESIGAVFDDIAPVNSTFEARTVLMVDQTSDWARHYFGIGAGLEAMPMVGRRLLLENDTIKVKVRLHPDNLDGKNWRPLEEEFPDRVAFSHPDTPLMTDIGKGSVAVGLFSTALVTAAACGLPTCFLWQQGWYYTPDLAAFTEEFFIEPDDFVHWILGTLACREEYDKRSIASQTAASTCFHDLHRCRFDRAFADRLLS